MDEKPIGKFLLLLLIIVGIIFVYLNFQKTPSEVSTPEKYQICEMYKKVDGEVSCSDAVDVALKGYPSGSVVWVEKKQVEVPNAPAPGETLKDVWSIELTLNEPLNIESRPVRNILVFVERSSGKLLMVRFKS